MSLKNFISRRARRGAEEVSLISAPLRPLREINSCLKPTFAPLRPLRETSPRETSLCVK